VGLTPAQRREAPTPPMEIPDCFQTNCFQVGRWEGVALRTLDFAAAGGAHLRDLYKYAWKPVVLQDT
jgi:hypothetical protein